MHENTKSLSNPITFSIIKVQAYAPNVQESCPKITFNWQESWYDKLSLFLCVFSFFWDEGTCSISGASVSISSGTFLLEERTRDLWLSTSVGRRLISCSSLSLSLCGQFVTVTGNFHAPFTTKVAKSDLRETGVKHTLVLGTGLLSKSSVALPHWSLAQILVDQLVGSPALIRSCYTNLAMLLNDFEEYTSYYTTKISSNEC